MKLGNFIMIIKRYNKEVVDMFEFLIGLLLVLMIFSVGFTLSVGIFSYIIFGEPILVLIGALTSASISGILLLIVVIKIIISCVECFIDEHLSR